MKKHCVGVGVGGVRGKEENRKKGNRVVGSGERLMGNVGQNVVGDGDM